jgi:hypothetical protein
MMDFLNWLLYVADGAVVVFLTIAPFAMGYIAWDAIRDRKIAK